MHELSVAESIVAIASKHAAGRQVAKVEVKVGHLRQVVPSALEFAFELVTMETPLEGAELVIETVPAEGRCRDCGADSVMSEFPLHCLQCNGLDMEVFAGTELLVDSLELEDELATTGRVG